MSVHPGNEWLNCQECVDFCLEYLEGSLAERERVLFQGHLDRCPECVTFFETYRRTPEISREAIALHMPSNVRDAVRSFLRENY